jgi:tetratricopeptide (TPR) repeat protein
MFTPQHRLLLSVATFGLGAYLLIRNDYTGALFLVASAFLAYGYFRYGTVWLAFREVAHGRMDAAAKLLAKVNHPEALASEQRAYFELASGLVCASRAQNERAEQHLRAALSHQLRTDNDRALAEAVLAQLLIARDQYAEALALVQKAVTRDCRPSIAARLQTLQEQLQGS